MKFYKQRHTYDCFLAATATALQRDYDALWPVAFQQRIEANKGSGNGLQAEGLAIAGLTPNVHYSSQPIRLKMPSVPQVLTDLFWGRRALLQVPSLNNAGMSHLILLLNGKIYDPSNLKTYNEVDDLTTVEWVTLFNEIDPYSPARWTGENSF